MSGMATMKVMKEVRSLVESPPEGIKVHFSEEDVTTLMFDLFGPVDTPFEGGCWRVKLQLAADHPASAPKGWFLTKIFHPNMNAKTGEICVSTLKKDWKPSLGLRHVCVSIRCLLIEPNPESALNEDAAKLMLDNYADYYARAKIMTKIHAKPTAEQAADQAAAAATEAATATAAAAAAATPSIAASADSSAAPVASSSPLLSTATSVSGEEEENKDTANVPAAAAVAVNAAAKKPVTAAVAASAAPVASKVAANAAAAAAAAEKAKALKKKSLKRI